jgi:hypothetical protein
MTLDANFTIEEDKMLKKILSYGLIGMLAIALLAGTAYVVLRPSRAQVWQEHRDAGVTASGQGYRGGQSVTVNAERGVTGGRGGQNGPGGGTDATDQGRQGRPTQSSGAALGTEKAVSADEWETVRGIATLTDHEVTVQTTDGEVIVGLGQAQYREEVGFTIDTGDEIVVNGFDEDGEFKACTVDNLTTGTSIVLRDEGGRPMWAGRGNLKNRP